MHHNIAFDEKESRRWLAGAEMAAEHLAPVASQIVVVSDREGDIYSMFARRPEAVDLVVRAAQDRVLAEGGHLFSAAAAWPILGTAQVKVQPKRPGDKGRTAEVTVKAGAVTIKRPNRAVNRREPRTLTLGLVEVREAVAPKGAGKPLLWHLLTTLPLAMLADAQEAVRLYRLRWRIEEVFRLMKSDGLDIEDSQLETAGRLLNLVHRSKRRLQPEFGKIDAKQKARSLSK
jgi:IS4 transposase